ncbi:hypothetical protein B0H63DRAFT_564718 [Podospora didyma]|uniref:Uncharacterized protein n=1 Tax=Podospora didyma TaxID=330526 RepID=A0AAE0K5S6_9PEZI|nr:hypothetical protein B0H63DRAFT_564718 [Podospora didyma]
MAVKLTPLAFQSQDIALPEWISLLTLCLAPVFAHVVAGVPTPTHLTPKKLRWHDMLAHYNPASIAWRYAAIADRRLRARDWTCADVAAANALFWTAEGWNGSETMVAASAPYVIHLPEKPRATFLSWDTVKTLVVTVQGFQVLYVCFVVSTRLKTMPTSFPVNELFFPVAVLGLQRLWAALWLTDDFAYTPRDISQPSADVGPLHSTANAPLKMLPTNRYHPPSFWPSRIFRALYVVPLLATWASCVEAFMPRSAGSPPSSPTPATVFMCLAAGLIYLPLTIAIFTYYTARHGCRSTIIPCIGSTWYKILTMLNFVAALAVMVVSAMETRRAPCGKYTTTGLESDFRICPGLVDVAPGGVFVLGSRVGFNNSTTAVQQEFQISNFTGVCQTL